MQPHLQADMSHELAAMAEDTLDWRTTETIKTAHAGGYCLRAPVQGSCPYANICEHCQSFHTTSSPIPVLTQQRDGATALAEDATGRGWDSETERHLKLINRINDLITAADARGQAM